MAEPEIKTQNNEPTLGQILDLGIWEKTAIWGIT